MRCVVELLNVQRVLLELDDRSFVIVHITVVGRREYSYHCRKLLLAVPLVHFVPVELCFVRSNNRKKFVFLKKLIGR